MIPKDKKIGLALGGGGAKGLAHIGVLQALEDKGIKVDFIAGSSIGALVGASYASGNFPYLKDYVENLTARKLASLYDITLPLSGMVSGTKVEKVIKELITANSFGELKTPFSTNALDLVSEKEIILKEGDLISAIRASISLPGIFNPVSKDDMVLVDGGLVNPLPVDIVKSMGAEFIIAVDLTKSINTVKQKQSNYKASEGGALSKLTGWITGRGKPKMFDVIMSSAVLMQIEITKLKLEKHKPDILIQPELSGTAVYEFHKHEEAINKGYEEMSDYL